VYAKADEIAKAAVPGGVIVFASLIPFLIKELAIQSVKENFNVKVFHNDRREKRSSPMVKSYKL